ncbi:MAG: CPXCG motif-containing cysteine-rich protein [Nannocystaceae bacterium]
MNDTVLVTCPYCFESVELVVDPGDFGLMIEDCAVCCRPWEVRVNRGDDGHPVVDVQRST